MERWMVMSFHMQHSGMRSEEKRGDKWGFKTHLAGVQGLKGHKEQQCGDLQAGDGLHSPEWEVWVLEVVLVFGGLGRGTGQKSTNRMVLWNIRVGSFATALLLDTGAVALWHPGGICGCSRSWMVTDFPEFLPSWLERDENNTADSELWCVVKLVPDTTNICHHWLQSKALSGGGNA